MKKRYSEGDGVQLYDIRKAISNTRQGNLTVTQYFTKLQKLWDELSSLRPLPVCSCEASKKLDEQKQEDKLIQFLMGLNEGFENIRSSILVMEPLLDIEKAYSMVTKVEK